MLTATGSYPYPRRESGREMLIRNALKHGVPMGDLPEFRDTEEAAFGFPRALAGLMRERLRLDPPAEPDQHVSPFFSDRTPSTGKPDPKKVSFLSDIFMRAMNERMER